MRGVMKAMVLTGHGGLDKYVWHEDWPMPEPGPMEAVTKVGACGLNNTDVNWSCPGFVDGYGFGRAGGSWLRS